VWGNHEDKDVVERIFRGDIQVKNLHILNHQRAYRVGPALVYGLGGNLLPGSKMVQKPIAGGGGKVWSTLSQYVDLVRTVDNVKDETNLRLLVSHVSPGKEPFVELMGARTRADFTISGHMGAPYCMVWNPFAIHSVEESIKRIDDSLEAVRTACMDTAGSDPEWVDEALTCIGRLPDETIPIYLYVPEASRIDFIAIYGKNEQDDLTMKQKKELKAFAAKAKTQAIQCSRKERR